ncbi:MAG: SWIM zinc finger family protein [Caulobacteraceae bacterium]|nr:SWIM zinc finger family protein [Caulobacteraceae bacterium]
MIDRQIRFDAAALRKAAGERFFARGEAYHLGGQVEILAVDSARILARVAGTEDYRTELIGGGDDIGGDCSCPAFVDWRFCKHMVAVALAANAMDEDGWVGALAARARVRDRLKREGLDALVDMVLAFAERDPSLYRELGIAAETGSDGDGTLAVCVRQAIMGEGWDGDGDYED